MSKARVAVLKVVTKELTVTAAAAKYGYSRQHLHRLLARYHADGIDAVDARSRRPRSNPKATSQQVRDLIIELRLQLTRDGLDAGPLTIAWHLEQAGHTAPSTSTIRRILHTAGLITPEPRKRPRASYRRFEASQPNECWQSDFTHWRLADNTDVEILNWLDDHARFLVSCTVHAPVTGDIVVNTFLAASNTHGLPAATLTDNGRVYTARFGGGKNAFEYLLAALRITQKNGSANHPQTQGKVERLHRTQKRWLAQQPTAATLTELQAQLDQFTETYNHHRPHRALGRATPASAYTALPKAAPTSTDPTSTDPTSTRHASTRHASTRHASTRHASTRHASSHYRLRYDHVDVWGKVSFRRAGRMHHLGVGHAHRGTKILAIADDTTITVIALETGEILSTHTIDPTKHYWRNTQKAPGRWPGAL